MLAQNFKTGAELGISEEQKDALIKTLVLLETEKLIHVPNPDLRGRATKFTGHFNMSNWALNAECGSICCIGGTAELIGGLPRDSLDQAAENNKPLHRLFYPFNAAAVSWSAITPSQAATALRSYLTTGDAGWDLAISS